MIIQQMLTKQEDIDYFINLTEHDITKSFLTNTFGIFEGVRKYNPYDYITIPPGYYGPEGKKNKTSFVTTLGIWCYNKLIIEQDLFHLFEGGYINHEVDKGINKLLGNTLSCAVIENEITTKQLANFKMKEQILMRLVSVLSQNYTVELFTISEKLKPVKEKLYKQYEEGLKAGDTAIANKVEKELLNTAIKMLEGDPGLDMYLSGARGSLGNDFKNMFVVKGLVYDSIKGFVFVDDCYIDGISADNYHILANSLVAGPVARAVNTAKGGYSEKIQNAATQHLMIDVPGSDCGTKKTISVELTKDNIMDNLYSFIVDNGKLVELTSKNMNDYIGKTVQMRFSNCCENEKFCEKCAGTLFNRLGITNIGLVLSKIQSKLKTTSMKSFHNSVINFTDIDLNVAFGITEDEVII